MESGYISLEKISRIDFGSFHYWPNISRFLATDESLDQIKIWRKPKNQLMFSTKLRYLMLAKFTILKKIAGSGSDWKISGRK